MEPRVGPLTTRARWVLRIALVIAWASGVGGTVSSCGLLAFYRGPAPARVTDLATAVPSVSASAVSSASASTVSSASAPTVPSVSAFTAPSVSASGVASAAPVVPRPSLKLTEAQAEVIAEGFDRFRRTRLPLTAANFVLSMALVVGAARTLGRRQGGRAWLQQVCVATALFAAVEFVASRDERRWLAEHLPKVHVEQLQQPGLTREQAEGILGGNVRFSFVLNLLWHLALYGGLAVALGRASVVAELAPVEGSRPSLPPSSSNSEDDDDA